MEMNKQTDIERVDVAMVGANAAGDYESLTYVINYGERQTVSDARVAYQPHLFVASIIPWNTFFSPANIGRIFIANFTYAFNRKYLSREELA